MAQQTKSPMIEGESKHDRRRRLINEANRRKYKERPEVRAAILAKGAAWRAANPELAKAAVDRCFDRYREQGIAHEVNARSKRDPMKLWASQVIRKARFCGEDIDLTREELLELLAPMVCQKTGLPLSFKVEDGSRARTHPWAPSLDRVDSDRGYMKGNVQLVCWAYNVAKNQWHEDVVLAMAEGLVNKKDKRQ